MATGEKVKQKQIADIQPLAEDTWKFFDIEAFKNSENTRLVKISQLITENLKAQDAAFLAGERDHPVYRAYDYFKRAVDGDISVKPRAPITVRGNGDGTYTVIDGLATTAAAKILGWKVLPVQVTEIAKNTETKNI